MENINFLNLGLNTNSLTTFSITTFIDFFLCLSLSLLLKYFYLRNSISLTGKKHISQVLPLLSLIVFLVILIVKSSLALSLGLVGALSIVRFRTPIKDPEELVYLFLSIAIGLGYGSGQTLTTTIIISLIFLFIFFLNRNITTNNGYEYNLLLSWKDNHINYKDLINKLKPEVESLKLIRYESNSEYFQLSLLIELKKESDFSNLQKVSHHYQNKIDISFNESNNNW